ncbi:MAG: hypothetical protein QOD02_631 [Mycobacterium sp.]|jgi:hypothetical protein|nr:hypothetical protein [Mycobacterium sp.]MDT5200694.1 hypothetical protein [Mycobacterium sp.]
MTASAALAGVPHGGRSVLPISTESFRGFDNDLGSTCESNDDFYGPLGIYDATGCRDRHTPTSGDAGNCSRAM